MRSRTGLRVLAGVAGIATVVAPSMVALSGAEAAETCFGLKPTITAPHGAVVVRGTQGDDVIVAEDVSRVVARGGDDAVCVTGPSRIEAGEGNDRVQSRSKAGTKNVVILGSGSDLFEGSKGNDWVYTERTRVDSEGWLEPYPGTGTENTDVVHTYGGADRVGSGAPLDGQANEDEVDLGAGDDMVWLVPGLEGDVQVSGGTGSDWFSLRAALRDAVAVSIDLSAGTAEADGVRVSTVEGFENIDVIHNPASPGSLLVRGNDAPNRIVAVVYNVDLVSIQTGAGDDNVYSGDVGSTDRPGRVSVQTGAGDDIVSASAVGSTDRPGRVSVQTGAGDDTLRLGGDPESVRGGFGRDTVVMFGYGDREFKPVVYDLARGLFQRGDVTAPFETEMLAVEIRSKARVLGTAGRDVITVAGCGTVVRGAGGNDLLRSRSETCRGVAPTLYGDSGDDVLRGGNDRDVLRGGAGRDRAFGGRGSDLCRAEFKRECER